MAALLGAAAAAGWVDAVVGGGGLLMLPALLLAGVPTTTALGTNKLTAITGTTTAAVTYLRRTRVDRRVALPAAGLAVLGSAMGAVAARSVPSAAFRPVILVVLVGVALFVAFRPRFGLMERPDRDTAGRRALAVALAGLVVAAYDGMIGPGTGMFLILLFTGVLGTDFVRASAAAKLVNVGTNLGALIVFASQGEVRWLLGAGMAVCNMAGAIVGTRMALRRGAGFVRMVLLVVVVALVARLGYDLVW